MNKSNVTKLIKSGQAKLSKHAPEILLTLGVTSMFSSIVLAVTATPKALESIDKAQTEKGEELTPVEKVKVAWKPYVPTVATFTFGTCCLIGANSAHTRRNAALAAAYKLSETAFSEYKEKVVETIGEKKEKTVRDKVAQDKIEKDPVTTKEVIITGKGTTLCYDSASGRYFESSVERIEHAINVINRTMTYDMYVSLNDLYDELGLSPTKLGNDLGWNLDHGLVEFDPTYGPAADGRPCLIMDYNVAPRYDYSKLM